ALLERPGVPVSKDALLHAAWPGLAVEENNLTVQIASLRRALREAPGGESWIETMPRRGYRFTAPVVAIDDALPAPPPRPESEAAPAGRGDAERRQITVLCCELIVAAPGAGGVDLEDLEQTVRTFRRCVADTARRHGGFIYRQLGNSGLA